MTLYVLILVSLLGHPRHTVREFASARLLKVVDLAPAVVLAAEQSIDKEVSFRATQVLGGWYRRHAEELVDRELPANWTKWPWIYAGIPDVADRSVFIEAWHRKVSYKPGDTDWQSYRDAARLWIIYEISQRHDVRELVLAMCLAEIAYYREHGLVAPHYPIWK